jgi:hypothetical protein
VSGPGGASKPKPLNIGPRVAGTAVAGGSAHAVTDGVTTIEIPLHDGIVARRLAWIDPADGVLRGAERVAMAWSPASDLAVPPASASVSHGDQDGDVTVDAAAPATGGTRS